MIIFGVFCFVLLVTSGQAIHSRPPVLSLLTQSKQVAKEPSKEDRNKKHELPLNQLLEQVGSDKKILIEESIFNESEPIKMCWKRVLYVNETLKLHITTWEEYQIVFYFPEEAEEPKNASSKEYRPYGIRNADEVMEVKDFEVIQNHPNFVVSKREYANCSSGKYLHKAYYEWQQGDKKKLVLRLSNNHTSFAFDRDDAINMSMEKEKTDSDAIVASPRKNIRQLWESTSSEDSIKTEKNDSEDELEVKAQDYGRSLVRAGRLEPVDLINPKKRNNTGGRKKSKNGNVSMEKVNNGSDDIVASPRKVFRQLSEEEPIELEEDDYGGEEKKTNDRTQNPGRPIVRPGRLNPFDVIKSKKKNYAGDWEKSSETVENPSLPSADSCSPFLSQLLSGNGLLPGICNLTQDEAVLLQGDILVSKKSFDKLSQTEVVTPMFVIHENTEIKPNAEDDRRKNNH